MNFSIIVAFAKNYVIGRLNSIPWILPKDMLWFKYHTLNKIVIMGSKTFVSIGSKPLSNRLNVVLSRKDLVKKSNIPNLFFVKTFEEALWVVRKEAYSYNNNSEIMIIGGGEVYNMFLSKVRRLYLTSIGMTFQGDTFFPNYEENEWKIIFHKSCNFHCGNYSYSFEIFERF